MATAAVLTGCVSGYSTDGLPSSPAYSCQLWNGEEETDIDAAAAALAAGDAASSSGVMPTAAMAIDIKSALGASAVAVEGLAPCELDGSPRGWRLGSSDTGCRLGRRRWTVPPARCCCAWGSAVALGLWPGLGLGLVWVEVMVWVRIWIRI